MGVFVADSCLFRNHSEIRSCESGKREARAVLFAAMHTKAFPYISLLGFIWGANLVVSRFGIGQFGSVVFAGLRLVIAGLAFVLVYAFSSRQLSRDRNLWRHAAILGFIGTAIPMTAMLSSLNFQSAGLSALLITTAPAFIALASHFFLPDEKLTRYKGIGVLMALTGALLVVGLGETGLAEQKEADPIGYLLVFTAIVFETTGAIYIRKYMRNMDIFDVTAIRVSVAGIIVLPLGLIFQGFEGGNVTGQGIISLLYAALAAAFMGQFLAFYITQRFGTTAFSLTAYIIPVVAAILGVLLLDETVTVWMAVGLVLIAIGIKLINRRDVAAVIQDPL